MTSLPMSTLFKAFAAVGLTVLAAITALNVPAASFTVSTPNPAASSVVAFTDTSGGGPTSWAWDFGDGGSSTQQNPTHVYANPGSYSATLTAANAIGSKSVSHTVPVSYGTTNTGDAFTYLLPSIFSVTIPEPICWKSTL